MITFETIATCVAKGGWRVNAEHPKKTDSSGQRVSQLGHATLIGKTPKVGESVLERKFKVSFYDGTVSVYKGRELEFLHEDE